MKGELDPNLLLAVGVKYYANPALRLGTEETDEMKEHTISVMKWIDARKGWLSCTLTADDKNDDPNAVFVCLAGKPVAHICKERALEVRGMLKNAPGHVLVTTIDSVCVKSSGLFLIRRPQVTYDYVTEDCGVDWSMWRINTGVCLPDEIFIRFDTLSVEIEQVVLQDLANCDVKLIDWYIRQWMQAVRYNQSREAFEKLLRYRGILYADDREEVRNLAVKLNVLSTLKGSTAFIDELVTGWWEELLTSPETIADYQRIKNRCQLTRNTMLMLLDIVEGVMREMPMNLYDDVGNVHKFFSHQNYLLPPYKSLNGVLSLMALRRLLCRDLELKEEPFWGSRYETYKDQNEVAFTIDDIKEYVEGSELETYELESLQKFTASLLRKYDSGEFSRLLMNAQSMGRLAIPARKPQVEIGELIMQKHIDREINVATGGSVNVK